MSDPRTVLNTAHLALQRGDQDEAGEAFVTAAWGFVDPSKLLGAGHGWRGLGHIAVAREERVQALQALDLAEAHYRLGVLLLLDQEDAASKTLVVDLKDGLATCLLMRAEQAMRMGDLEGARVAIDEVFPFYNELGDRRSVADLWSLTARLAERQGRWYAARTAWEQTLQVRERHHDEPGQADAMLRLAEAMLHEEALPPAREWIAKALALSRDLEDELLRGRCYAVEARLYELEHDFEGAWEKWNDALALLERNPSTLGLTQIRMARSASRVRPMEAVGLLQMGLSHLIEARHPRAISLVLHQLALVSLDQNDFDRAVLAAAGAYQAHGMRENRVAGALFRSLMRLGALPVARLLTALRHTRQPEAGYDSTLQLIDDLLVRQEGELSALPEGEEELLAAFTEALNTWIHPLAIARGLTVEELGSQRAASRLCTHLEISAQATPAPAPMRRIPVMTWVIREGEVERFAIREGVNVVGRSGDCSLRMAWDAMASRTHCSLERGEGESVYVKDLRSHHGISIDGIRVEGEAMWRPGQTLTVGETDFELVFGAPPTVASVLIRADN